MSTADLCFGLGNKWLVRYFMCISDLCFEYEKKMVGLVI